MSSAVPFNRSSRSAVFERPLPSNIEAEKIILASILTDESTLAAIQKELKPDDFFHESNRAIYRHMLAMSEKKEFIDLITFTDSLAAARKETFAGGIPYVASLCDGAMKIANLDHYVKLVKKKSQLRTTIHNAYNVAMRGMEEDATPERLRNDLEIAVQEINITQPDQLKLIESHALMMLDLKPLDYVITPILPLKGLGMLYATRGAGKTYIALEIAHCVAIGAAKCFVWEIPQARRVVYVDGEMDIETLQERHREIVKGHGGAPAPEGMLLFITPDLQEKMVLKINTAEGRAAIEAVLKTGDLLILDNLSALAPSSTEEETGDWVDIQAWLLHLRRRGITCLFMHHAGKSGTQRGSSVKEDLLNVVISLRRGSGYQVEDQLRVEVHLEKLRGKAAVGEWVQPFELSLTTDVQEGAQWLHKPLKHLIEKQAFEMLATGMKPNDVAGELRLSRFQVYRLRQKFNTGQTPPEDSAD